MYFYLRVPLGIISGFSLLLACFLLLSNVAYAVILANPKGKIDAAMTPRVEVVKEKLGYRLYRNGRPYYIKGAAGRDHLEWVKACGGNSIRTWTAEGMDTLLNRADSLGLTVAVGIHLERERQGFDYGDSTAVAQQRQRVRQTVSRYKDHPAVLFWILGNELDLLADHPERIWPALNDLAQMAKQLDPNHPVTVSSVGDIASIRQITQSCPALDFISINAFAGLPSIQKQIREELPAYNGPYLFSEWGAPGYWERPMTHWMAAMEPSIKEKYDLFFRHYNLQILSRSQRCLGSYVFYWGHKQERTPSWFSLFLEKGEKTPLVDLMMRLWSKQEPENEAPFLYDLKIAGRVQEPGLYLQPDTVYEATVGYSDAEKDSLTFWWEVLDEKDKMRGDGGDWEPRPSSRPELIVHQQGWKIQFCTPRSSGPFRLIVTATDGNGNGAMTNIPFFVSDGRLPDD